MAFSSKKPSLNKIFLLVFGIAFGLVGLALAFQGAKTASDIRSRAAQSNQIYKQWEFNGADTEGWQAISPYSGSVRGGIFVISGGKSSALPGFRDTGIGVSLPQGLKSLSMSMAVGSFKIPSQIRPMPIERRPVDSSVRGVSDTADDTTFQRSVSSKVACTMDARVCPDGTYVGRAGTSCAFTACPGKGQKQRRFVAHVYYKIAGRDKYERPIQISGVADGSFATYAVNLPNAESITLDSIRVVFASGVKNAEMVGVDWVRILGPVVKPSPRPSCIPVPSCAAGRPCPQYYPQQGFCTTTTTPAPCVPKPTCVPGQRCIEPQYYPQGGWCGTPSPAAKCVCPGSTYLCPNGNVGLCPDVKPPAGTSGCVKQCDAKTGVCQTICYQPAVVSTSTPTPTPTPTPTLPQTQPPSFYPAQ